MNLHQHQKKTPFRFVEGFIGWRNVFLQGDRVPQFTFALPLQFLNMNHRNAPGSVT